MQRLMPFPPLATRLAFWSFLVAVAVLSLMPTDFLPPPVLSLWDKAQHAAGFAGLTILGLMAFPQRPRRLFLSLLLFGAAIEVAQAATGWRQGDVIDLLADAVGIAMGGELFQWIGRRGRD